MNSPQPGVPFVPHYPIAAPPAGGTAMAVAAGVHWLRMPLPFALDHINLWLLDEGDGWTLVDCGLNTPVTRENWERIFRDVLAPRPVKRLIVTHHHPDHIGLAGWLVEKFGVPMWMTAGEYLVCLAAYAGSAGYSVDPVSNLFHTHGLDSERLASLQTRGNSYRRGIVEPPACYHRIFHGDSIAVGSHPWRVITGFGHAPEHAALYCASLGVLISGDMLLPKISTNVGVWPAEPEGDPLQLFLNSIDRFLDLPSDTLVLPSHGLPFRGIQGRVADLHAHHAARLAEVLEACAEPRSAAELMPLLFRRQLDTHQLFFAMGEAIAHLHRLMYEGRLERQRGADGVSRFLARAA
jgi:glyoxylase-like metal-dependent hydrolase (beta-lactamase superfamily II)